MSDRERGIVKWFSDQKGYGFIQRESGQDVFVHYSEITGSGFRTLAEGEKVEFEVQQADRGPQAVDVERLDPPAEKTQPRVRTLSQSRKQFAQARREAKNPGLMEDDEEEGSES